MEGDLYVDQRVGRDLGPLGGELLGVGLLAQDRAVDELHHVERRVVDRRVGARREAHGYRYIGAGQGGHDPELAVHVVSRGQAAAHRRAAQDPPVIGCVGDREREVGAARRDQLVAERCGGSRHALGEERVDGRTIDPTDLLAHPGDPSDPARDDAEVAAPGRMPQRRARRRPDVQLSRSSTQPNGEVVGKSGSVACLQAAASRGRVPGGRKASVA